MRMEGGRDDRVKQQEDTSGESCGKVVRGGDKSFGAAKICNGILNSCLYLLISDVCSLSSLLQGLLVFAESTGLPISMYFDEPGR